MTLKYLIENILFVSGEPISIKKLAQILDAKEEDVAKETAELKNELEGRGLRILERDEKIQMITSPEASQYVEKIIAGNLKEELSEAGLETLTAVSYLGPATKSEIEELRGVNCSFTLRNLLIRGLIDKIDGGGGQKSPRYMISMDFLKHLGINSEKDLPDYEKYREEIKNIIEQNKNNGELAESEKN